MSVGIDGASNMPLERTAARVRSLAAAHCQRSASEEARDPV